tara:strand:+ start:37764 stop:38576 length:813 start_codon:yes stop_codon:yes gene_type:complete
MSSLGEYCKTLLDGTDLSEKLYQVDNIDFDLCYEPHESKTPGRPKHLEFSSVQAKFPKKTTFHLDEKKGVALHFFANHELLAIEMFAQALLLFPEVDTQTKKSVLATIHDEQKHLEIYIKRMNDFGVEFGDLPVNSFFWEYMPAVKSFEEFYALMALTFEQANLDFASYYRSIFNEIEDFESAKIMDTVYKDEISHVARGVKYIKSKIKDQSLFEYYQELLPDKISPSRGKGITFDFEGRQLAGLDHDFINSLDSYRDDFSVVNRKQWKK